MNEELLAIVERMEAAGEDPREIAAVVKAFKARQPQAPDAAIEKKNPDQSEPSGESPTEDIKLDSTDPKVEDGSSESENEPSVGEDMWNSIKAGTKEALAGLAGVPNLINKGVFSLVAPQEVEDYVNTLEPEQRETFINNMVGMGGATTAAGSMGALGEIGADKQEELNKEAEGIREQMTQYDASITEDLGNLEFSQAGRRIAVEGVGAIPSVLQAMIPYVGLASVGAGSAANKQERLEADGEDFGGKTVINSVLTGAVESLLEKYTAKQGKNLIKAIIGKGDKAIAKGVNGFIDGLKEVGKGMLKEGGTEGLQAASENLIDALTTGNEKEAFEIFTEISDSFLIGMAVGAPMKGGEVVANNLRAGIEQKKNTNESPDIQPLEDGTVDLNIPAVEPLEELKRQLEYVTNKEGIEPDVRAGIMKELGDKISALETDKANQPFELDTKEEAETDPIDVTVAPDTDEPVETQATNAINKGRKNGVSDENIIEGIEDKEVKSTAEIVLQREKHQGISNEEAATLSKEAAEKSRNEEKRADKQYLTDVELAVNKAKDLYTDRQGSVKSIIDNSGLETTTDYMVTNLGASSHAKAVTLDAHKKTFDGLKSKDVKELEEIILLKNIISIDSERARLGAAPVKHQGGQTGVSAAKALEGYKARLGDKKFKQFEEKAKNYFDVNKETLTTMKKEGLITEELYDKIITRDYQSRVFLDFMQDMDNNFLSEELDNFETSTLSGEQVKRMKGGWEGSQSMDSQTLQQRSILAKTKAVFANRLNNSFADELKPALASIPALEAKKNRSAKEDKKLRNLKQLNTSVKMDKIIGFSETTGKPKYAMEKTNTDGYKAIYYYKDGVANRIWMKEDFYNKFTDTSNQLLNASTREGISKATGVRLLKTLATGENPLFFITNVPRDLAFALAFSKEYGSSFTIPTGGGKRIGINIVPIEVIKLVRDFGVGAGQAIAKGSLYNKYIEYGGGMDFLTVQGRYGKEGIFNKYVEGKVAEKMVDIKQTGGVKAAQWLRDGIKRFNTASEFATRIAVFDRSIKNQLKKMGVKNIDALTKEKQDQVYTKAVRSARELTDFNQGGRHVKAADAAIPYLNAATQGTRSAINSFKERPMETVWRTLQISAGFTAASITFAFNYIGVNKDMEDESIAKMTDQEIYFETLKGVSPYDLRNYYIIPQGVKDSKGKWMYYRIAKAQSLSPFINTSEHFLRKFYSEAHQIEYKQDWGKELKETVYSNVLPVAPTFESTAFRNPFVSAGVASLGIDSYTGNPLDWKRGKIPEQLEGINDPNVEQFYKDMGEMVDYSPVRMKAMVESFVTTPSTNPYVGFAYMGAEYISSGEKKDMLKELGKTSMKRFQKSTSEYNEITKVLESVSDQTVDAYRKHMTMEYEVRKAVKKIKADGNEDDLEAILTKTYKESPDMLEKSVKWAKSELEKKSLSPFVNSLKYERNKEVRAIVLAEQFGDALLKSEDSYTQKEKDIVTELVKEGVIDKEVFAYYNKLVKK
tara:strand:+ start:17583 stop:22085 length:4503 start_codon:yes stop_codon:yes gene_type:complete